MTTIIAVEYEDKAIIACDSKVTDGSGEWWSHPSCRKIRQVNKEILMGGSGEVAALDIALHIWQPPKTTVEDRKDYYHFVIAKLVPSLKECFTANHYKWNPDKDEDDDDDKFNFLLVIGGQVFQFGMDFGVVQRAEGRYGIGSGSSMALGALRTGSTMQEAMELSAKHDDFSDAPFYFYEQLRK